MDLRVKKTKRAIRTALFELIQTKPVTKITVRELCERAEINKTTFYAHYETIYDLLGTLEQELIQELCENLDNFGLLFDNPRAFVYNLYESFDFCKADSIQPFSSESHDFIMRVSAAIEKKTRERGIRPEAYPDIGVLLSFLINGLIGIQKNRDTNLSRDELEYLATFVEGGIRILPPPVEYRADT